MVEIVTLDNGLKLVMEPMSSVRTIAFGIFIKTGSGNEKENEKGISHFIEHMLFKGTTNRTAKDIADAIDMIGGQLNAFTAKEYTCFYVRVLDTHFDRALDVLSDMFFNSSFLPSEMKKEWQVICEEILMYEDTPDDLIFDILQSSVWKGHALGNPILGSKEILEGLTQNDLFSYMENQYTSEQIVVSVAGNLDTDKMTEKLQAVFEKVKRPVKKETTQEVVYTPVSEKVYKDIEQLHIAMAFPGFPRGSHEAISVSLLNLVFGGSMSSRLFQKIREEKGLVYTVLSFHSTFIDTGLFNIYAALTPKNGEETIELIAKEILKLETNPITEDQLSAAKEQMKSSLVVNLENTSNRMQANGRHVLFQNRIFTVDEQIKRMEVITMKDIEDVRDIQFNMKNLSLCTVGDWKVDQETLTASLRES